MHLLHDIFFKTAKQVNKKARLTEVRREILITSTILFRKSLIRPSCHVTGDHMRYKRALTGHVPICFEISCDLQSRDREVEFKN